MTDKEKKSELVEKIRSVLHWLNDLDAGEMIECKGWTRTHMSFDNISENNLALICKSVNSLLTVINHPRRINWDMGEIVSYKV